MRVQLLTCVLTCFYRNANTHMHAYMLFVLCNLGNMTCSTLFRNYMHDQSMRIKMPTKYFEVSATPLKYFGT